MILNKNIMYHFQKKRSVKWNRSQKRWDTKYRKKDTQRKQERKLIVVFCSNLTNPYYVMLLQGIESRAKEKGYGLFVCNTRGI